MRFILNWLLTSVAVAVSAAIVPGIAPFGGADPGSASCSWGSPSPWSTRS